MIPVPVPVAARTAAIAASVPRTTRRVTPVRHRPARCLITWPSNNPDVGTSRGRAIARGADALTAGMYLVGCAYNFCWFHDSLRVAAGPESCRKWRERTPAMAAGLTDRRWAMREWLSQPIPPPPWVPPKRRGRPPKRLQAAMA